MVCSVGEGWWEKVYEAAGRENWISAVWAAGNGEWFVAGKWGVTRGGKGGGEQESAPGHGVLGLVGDAPSDVFALGSDELILHFDGKKWEQQHLRITPKRAHNVEDILFSVGHVEVQADAPLVAYGHWLVLVREANGAWVAPPEKERQRLFESANFGPKISLPSRCSKAGWQWLGKGAAWFYCHDGRSFLFRSGAVTANGDLPRPCQRDVDALTLGRGELYASCYGGTLWKTERSEWQRLEAPKDQHEIGSIAVTDHCIFVAGRYSVWRRCDDGKPPS